MRALRRLGREPDAPLVDAPEASQHDFTRCLRTITTIPISISPYLRPREPRSGRRSPAQHPRMLSSHSSTKKSGQRIEPIRATRAAHLVDDPLVGHRLLSGSDRPGEHDGHFVAQQVARIAELFIFSWIQDFCAQSPAKKTFAVDRSCASVPSALRNLGPCRPVPMLV